MKLSRWPHSENRIDADQRAGQASDAKRIAPFPSRSTRMRKALRGYAKDKMAISFLLAPCRSPLARRLVCSRSCVSGEGVSRIDRADYQLGSTVARKQLVTCEEIS